MGIKHFGYEPMKPISITLPKSILDAMDAMNPESRSDFIRKAIADFFATFLMSRNIEPKIKSAILSDPDSLFEWVKMLALAEFGGAKNIELFRDAEGRLVNVIELSDTK